MSTLKSSGRGGQWLSALAVSAIATMAGGAMDAWVYFAHGHVFANTQSGNVVLMGIAFAGGDVASAATHLPSFGGWMRRSVDAASMAKVPPSARHFH